MKPSVTIILDTRSSLQNGKKYPLKLRIGLSRNDSRKFSLGLSFSKTEFEKLLKFRMKDPHKDVWNKIDASVKKAEHVVEGLMPYFNFKAFRERFYDTKSFQIVSDKTSLLAVREIVMRKYIDDGNYPMSVKISDSVASILKFAKKDNIPMRSITPQFCRKYEEYMFGKSKTKTRNGAGINLRHIRILFNNAISKKLIPKEWYPFKRESGESSEFENPYVIPNEAKVKTYLKEDEFVKFAEANNFASVKQEEAHAAFLISFFCNGANAADFLRFKFRDIQGDFIIFYREKIKNTFKSNLRPIKVFLSPELKNLMKKYGNEPLPENYVFRCYTDEMSDEERYLARLKFNRSASKCLRLITKRLNIKKNISIGKARHSLANLLKRNGVDREFVKDIFGHTSILTTDNYYDQFEEDQHTSIFNNIVAVDKIKMRLTSSGNQPHE